jgi:hypothetical protein
MRPPFPELMEERVCCELMIEPLGLEWTFHQTTLRGKPSVAFMWDKKI